MKATKLPSGNYRAIAYIGRDENGKIITKSFTSPSAKHAVALATDYEDKYKTATDMGTFESALDRFVRSRESTTSPTTYADYISRARMLKKHYKSFCKKHLVAITSKDLSDLIADMASVHAPRHTLHKDPVALSPKTIKNYIGIISATFRYVGMQMPPAAVPSKTVPDIYVPTDAEVKILIDFVRGTDMYVPVLLAAFGPLRRGEIVALDYPRDFSGNVIHVSESMAKDRKNKFTRKGPKTPGSNRRIEMPAFVIDVIKDQGYVTNLNLNQITSNFPRILKRAGLPPFRFHDLRHYCVSTLHAQNVPDAYIMQRGGWSTDAVLKKVYRHTLADQEKENTKKALDHFSSVFNS